MMSRFDRDSGLKKYKRKIEGADVLHVVFASVRG